ncbi:late embryogenesis abundant protein D-34-like [Nicotiana tabacum]|uniref:Late embryogenesis abundant protein D-34-like n=1 Tax=Nicotiana tabacum TaxID=4097 RepID=A0AC58TD98_TOBAC
MSQEQPIKYGDVFEVSSQLASKPVAPQDATIMQSAESIALGHVPKGGPASIMQSATAQNERIGAVSRDDMTDIARDEGVTVSQAEVVGQYIYPSEAGDGERAARYPTTGVQSESTTIGEALEAVALTAGDKPIEQSDAAAIQAAEVRATGLGEVMPGGIGAEAQHAAAINARTTPEDDKTTLSDVLTDETSRLIGDKAVKKEDAEGVVGAEIRTKSDLATHLGGVAASMAVASSLNEF